MKTALVYALSVSLSALSSAAFAAGRPRQAAPVPVQRLAAEAAEPITAQAPATGAPTLKSEAIVSGEIVRLSDLVSGVDPRQDLPVFQAPEVGQVGTIQAARVLSAAADAGLLSIDTRDITAIIVRRSGHLVPQDQIADIVRDALVRRFSLPPDTEIVPEKATRPMIVEAEARRSPQLSSFIFDNRSNRFEAILIVPGSDITAKTPYRIAGQLGDFVRVPVVTRSLAKGDTIGANDISVERRKRIDFTGDVLTDPDRVAGQIAKHSMRSGDLIAASDIAKAEWVERGQSVTLVYETEGMSLSTKGRAVTAGGEGETVTVQNLQSKRTVEGVITGPGKVSVQNRTVQPIQKTSLLGTGAR